MRYPNLELLHAPAAVAAAEVGVAGIRASATHTAVVGVAERAIAGGHAVAQVEIVAVTEGRTVAASAVGGR